VVVVPKMTTIMARFAAKVLKEKPVLLPMVAVGDEEAINPSWKTARQGIELFSLLLESMHQQPAGDR
ncbi:MAG: hypothetical protein JXA18_12515, partial [Chitinispirillaceae bacterium]|nr:hypothetical protein [Chitinispirillaceae bacterium]